MRFPRPPVLAAALFPVFGCHSHYIDASIRNGTSEPISLVEVDYPSASFGTQTLEAGKEYTYRFKVLGSGDLKLLYTDAAHGEHTVPGPGLKEGDEGPLVITLAPGGVSWSPPAIKRTTRSEDAQHSAAREP